MSLNNPMRRARIILSLMILVVPLATGLDAFGGSAQPLQPEDSSAASLVQQDSPVPTHEAPPGPNRWVVRAYYADRQMADELAAWREPWEVHHEEGYLVLDVTPAEYRQLLEAGFRLEIDERLTAQLRHPNTPAAGQVSGIPGYPCYRTVTETFATAEAIVANHPGLAAWIDIGDTWDKTEPGGDAGHDMMVLRLTNAAIPSPKPKLFIMTSVHARELTPAELGTRFAEYLAEGYGSHPDVTWLLDYHEIHLLLQANPDGRKRVEGGGTGINWRKNTNMNHCPYALWPGVDLNRNFEFQWGCCGGSSGLECSEVYRGPIPASEPETQAIQSYVRAQYPDQRQDDLAAAAPITATGVFLDIHSYSELVMWPWSATTTPAPNGTSLQTLGRKFAFFNHYTPQQGADLYLTDGATDGFAYGELGLAAYTFELGTRFFQDCATFENTILPDNLPALVYAAKVSRAPYLTPAGPEALDLVVVPETPVLNQTAHLTATIDDTRYAGPDGGEPSQNIVAAEFYIDVPPWITATTPIAYAMTAVDGVFDQEIQEVQGSIDTTGLGLGRHTIYVRGKDAGDNWGAFSAVFLYVAGPHQSYVPLVIKPH